MPINLTKGQKVDLTKGNPGLKSIMVGLAGGMSMRLIQAMILTLTQQRFFWETAENVQQRRNLFSMEILSIQARL